MLQGIKVLDLTHYQAGPMATLCLAELGAEVIKIEPLWGDNARHIEPIVNGLSPYFAHLNKDKKSMTINLKSNEGRKIFLELVKKADVVTENFAPGVMNRLGINYEVLREYNDKIILLSISGFGQTGPYKSRRSFDAIAQAISGFMYLNGDEYEDPVFPRIIPEALGDTIPGLYGAIGVLSALYYRNYTGKGQHIDIAQLDSLASVNISMTYHAMTGQSWARAKGHLYGPPTISYITGLHKAKDGFLFIGAVQGAIRERFEKVLNVEELNSQNIQSWIENKTSEEVVNTCLEAGVPVAPVLSLGQALEDPQLIERGMIAQVKNPETQYTTIGFPIKFSESPVNVKDGAPILGQHTEEILMNYLNMSKEKIIQLKNEKII